MNNDTPTNKKILVIHHSADWDGIFSREIAGKFLGDSADYIGWDYGQPVPVIPACVERLYMIDISIKGLMDDKRLIWIDHHKSAMEEFGTDASGYTIAGYRIDGVAACRLAWQWFLLHEAWDAREQHPPADLPVKEDYFNRTVSEPLSVRLAGEYDIWDKRDSRAELFQHGLRSQKIDRMWELLLNGPHKPSISEIEASIDVGHPLDLQPDGTVDSCVPWVETLLHQGEAIQFFKTNENESIIKAYGFSADFEGLKFLCCNHARFNSHLFTAGIRPEHDALFGFVYDGTKGVWRISLYHAPGKEQHDLSEIAKKFGGGGHRGACGFQVKRLPVGVPCEAQTVAGTMYTAYCEAVGGKAFNGDTLPSWSEFKNDPNKSKQANAWISAALAVS